MSMLFDVDHWVEIWQTLTKNRLRTSLTAFGVFWGIFLLVILLGSGRGLQNGVTAGFGDSATNSLFLWGQRTSKPFAGLPAGREIRFNNADTATILAQIPEAEIVAPRDQLGGFRGSNTVKRKGETGAYSVMGDQPEIAKIQSLQITAGRFLNRIDLDHKRKVAVIGQRVRDVLFEAEEEPVGDAIEINGVYFQVVGVFKTRATGNQAERDLQTIYVPFTTYQQAFNTGDEVGWYAITSKPSIPVTVVQEKVLALLGQRHKVAPDDKRAIGFFNLEKEYQQVQGLFLGIRLLMWIVGVGTLAAGAIGVSNIMLIVVKERTKEIGIRRAIGATPGSVRLQIVVEALILTSVAGYLGLAAGVGVLELVSFGLEKSGGSRMFADPGIDFAGAMQALAVLVACGVVAGLAPAQRAVAMAPVVALRSE